MREISPILVALDLDSGGDDALREGHLRAASLGAPLIVCHVLSGQSGSYQEVRELVADRVRSETGRGLDGAGVDVVLLEGPVPEAIVAEATARGVRLIVIGPGGIHLGTGSITGRVIRHASCAVLVARPAVRSGIVVAGTDFSDASYSAIVRGASEARRIGGELVAVHVVPIEPILEADVMGMGVVSMPSAALTEELRQAAQEKLAILLRERRLSGRVHAVGGQPGPELTRLAAALPAHLVVVGTHGRTGWRRFLVGSVAEEVARAAACSVLVERHGE